MYSLLIRIESFFLESSKALINACLYVSCWLTAQFISFIIKDVHILCIMLQGNLVNHLVIQKYQTSVFFELQPSFGVITEV